MDNYSITDWCAQFIRQQIKPGDLCIDATMGNGNDTLLLCKLCGDCGHVLAFDIQPIALKNTAALLQKEQVPDNFSLILDSHSHMNQYANPETVSCIVFNFGYLPGGDHSLATSEKTSISALTCALSLLKKGGILSLCIYSGGDSGYQERNAILSWLKTLDYKTYLVIKSDYYNRPNDPPIPVLVIRLR